ncbi:MAG TPA: hypothetical protein VLN42_02545 [Casimicrobiaceae bacterium]|nr:hypothetical protein [Casimicrobiaceae bacterium]
MSRVGPVRSLLRYVAQAALYAAFVAVIGYFSNSPAYQHLPADDALLKLSLSHAGVRKQACHQRSAEELAKLAPNMRAQSVCPRERASVIVEVDVDGAKVFHVVAVPSGFAKDGASTIYRRLPIVAGTHRITARLSDTPEGTFDYTRDATLDLAPGRVIVVDFDPAQGGFIIRG